MRWQNYILNKNSENSKIFWQDYLKASKDMLYIHGLGFDPRTLNGLKDIYSIGGEGKRDVLSIKYFQNEEEEKSNDIKPEISAHEYELHAFLDKIENVNHTIKSLITRAEQKSIASIKAHLIIDSLNELTPYTDIIVDISAMSRGVFIPLLHKILNLIDSHESVINLHVVVTENYLLDTQIEDDGVYPPEQLHLHLPRKEFL